MSEFREYINEAIKPKALGKKAAGVITQFQKDNRKRKDKVTKDLNTLFKKELLGKYLSNFDVRLGTQKITEVDVSAEYDIDGEWVVEIDTTEGGYISFNISEDDEWADLVLKDKK